MFFLCLQENEWNPDARYDCPDGFHHASTAQVRRLTSLATQFVYVAVASYLERDKTVKGSILVSRPRVSHLCHTTESTVSIAPRSVSTNRDSSCSPERTRTTVKRPPPSRRCTSDSAAGTVILGVHALEFTSASPTVEGTNLANGAYSLPPFALFTYPCTCMMLDNTRATVRHAHIALTNRAGTNTTPSPHALFAILQHRRLQARWSP